MVVVSHFFSFFDKKLGRIINDPTQTYFLYKNADAPIS